MDDALGRWRQQGKVYLWRYTAPNTRKFEGWHFAADRLGRDSLLELIDMQLAAAFPGAVRIRVTPHRDRPQPANFDAPGLKWRSPLHWTLEVRSKFAAEHWNLPAQVGEEVVLQLGRHCLLEFRRAVAGLDPKLPDTWDYSIGDDGRERLWIWPPPGPW